MAGYGEAEIRIRVGPDGYPEWQHGLQEWHLTPAQQETFADLHAAYVSLQRALAMQQHILDSAVAQRAMREMP